MKIFLFLVLALSTLLGASIQWEHDYTEGVKQVKTLNKPMLFIVSSHHCRYCVQLESTTLKDPRVIQKVNAAYVPVIVYMEDRPLFPREFYAGGTPTTWFIKGDGNAMFKPLMGALDASSFLEALTIVTTEYKKISK
jgi:thioredoxin-related protein